MLKFEYKQGYWLMKQSKYIFVMFTQFIEEFFIKVRSTFIYTSFFSVHRAHCIVMAVHRSDTFLFVNNQFSHARRCSQLFMWVSTQHSRRSFDFASLLHTYWMSATRVFEPCANKFETSVRTNRGILQLMNLTLQFSV